jgi:acyl-CoA thioester hydrolase
MLVSETNLRVRYAETDKMGVVYYGNYPQYYEVGRVECLRRLGTSYKALEENGFYMPVASMNICYHKPAFYDDNLRIRTTVKEMPGVRMDFFYEIFNEKDELLNTGETTLVFMSEETHRPSRPPSWFLELLKAYF